MTRFIAILFISLSAIATSYAETRYVSDTLEINMRSGPSTAYKIIRTPDSGTPVTVLETDKSTGYSRVRLRSGTEGWVLTRLLMDKPAAKEQLAKALETIKVLQSSSTNAQKELIALKDTHQRLERKAKNLSASNAKLEKELASIKKTAANAINIERENKKITKELLSLERNHQLLQQQTEALKDRREKDWFLAGAIVLFSGMLMGFFIPKLRFKKKNSWGSPL